MRQKIDRRLCEKPLLRMSRMSRVLRLTGGRAPRCENRKERKT